MKEDNYSFENLKNFPYIRLLQKETGRFYGPTNSLFPRVATEDYYLKDIPMKKGTFVYPRFNPNLFSNEYFDNPLEFNPERFEDEDKEQHPYVLVNFSAGARTCIGKHLALLESKLALIKIMKRYKTMIPPSEPLKFKFGLTVGAEVYVKVKKH